MVTALINQHLEIRPELEQTRIAVGDFVELRLARVLSFKSSSNCRGAIRLAAVTRSVCKARIRWLSVLWLVRVLPARKWVLLLWQCAIKAS